MINLNRVAAVIIRHIYLYKHSLDRLSDSFYWPAMDLLLWGFTSLYIQKQSQTIPGIVVAFLTGLVFWLVVWRGQYEITVNLLEEMWSHNLVNLFTSPLKISEWVLAVMILGIFKMTLTFVFAGFLAHVLYQVNIFSFGFLLLPFFLSLLATGWFAGFFVGGLIIRFGTRIQTIAWSGVMLLAPFSAIYYPVSVLPSWAQKVASFIPTSYIFEGMREILSTGHFSSEKLITSFILNIFYLTLTILFFRYMFEKSKSIGLSRLE
jgi:ABC-2 type transport system permease protein